MIGAGGGRDVLSAALFGLKQITAVELNPILVDLQTQSDGLLSFHQSRALFPGVRFVADEGRSWLARSRSSFDVIQMSLVDTWAATGAGAFTLSENGLYTVDAWKIFIEPPHAERRSHRQPLVRSEQAGRDRTGSSAWRRRP